MTTLDASLRRVHAELTALRVSFALVGGLAVSARTEPRFTRDADLAVAVLDDVEAEALIKRLSARGYVTSAVLEQKATGRLATVRLTHGPPAEGPVVDLLFASSGIEPELVLAAEPMQLLEGLTVPVAQPGHLIALKVLSRDDVSRPQDLVDLRALLRVAKAGDVRVAASALELITARGYHRGKNLVADLQALL